MITTVEGQITNAVEYPVGSTLDLAASAGATSLTVADLDAFGDAGRLQIGVEIISYSVGATTLLLTTPLGSAYPVDTPVTTYPTQVERWVYFREDNSEEDFSALIPTDLWDRIPLGTRDEDGEQIAARRIDDHLELRTLIAHTPDVDGSFLAPASVQGGSIGSVNGAVIYGDIAGNFIGTIDAGSITGTILSTQIGSITAGQITGTISSGQIGSVAATSITGTITSSQIGSVSAATITGSISAGQIGSVNASAISGGIVAAQITSVNAGAISGSITAGQIDTVNASDIAGSILASQIDTVNAADITGGIVAAQITSVTASTITGGISASQITSVNATAISGSILAAQIDTVNAGDITGGITSSQITSVAAGSVTGTLTSSQIGSVAAGTITGTLTSSQIGSVAAGTITGTLTASQIGTVNAGSLVTPGGLSDIDTNLGSITAGSITSATITGSTIRTSASNPRVYMDSTGLYAVNSSAVTTFAVDAATGKITTLAGIGGGNLIKNGSFEDGVTTHIDNYNNALSPAPTYDSFTPSAFVAKHGTKVGRITNGTDVVGDFGFTTKMADLPAVEVGKEYTLSCWSRVASGSSTFRVHIHWLTSGDVIIGGGSTSAAFIGSSTAWTRASVTGTAPATAAKALCYVWATNPTSGQVHYFDGLQLEEGALVTAFAPKPDEILPNTVSSGMISSVNAATITVGTLVSTQISSVAASTISVGTIVSTQISSINAATITVGTIASTQIGSVNAASITVGTISASQIGSVNVGSFQGQMGGANKLYDSNMERSDLTYWSGYSTTQAKSGDYERSGTQSLKVTQTTNGVQGHAMTGSAGVVPFENGTKIVGSAWVYSTVARTFVVGIQRRARAGGGYLGGLASGTNTAVPANTWTRVVCPATVNTSGEAFDIYVQQITAAVAGDIYYVDDAQLEEGEFPSAYGPRPDEVLPLSITADQIGSVNAATITVNTLVSTQISSINAATITVGYIQGTQIQAINAATITVGQIASTQIGSVNAATITVGYIQGSQIQNINAASITVGQIAHTQIGTINATTITIGQLEHGQINTVNAASLTVGQIMANQIHADAINAKTITGALFRTASSGSRLEVGLDDPLAVTPAFLGIKAFKVDPVTSVVTNPFVLDAKTGDVRVSGLVDFGSGSHLQADDVIELKSQGASQTPTIVQSIEHLGNAGGASGTPLVLLPGQTAAGNLLMIALLWQSPSGTPVAPTSWTHLSTTTHSSTWNLSIYYRQNAPADWWAPPFGSLPTNTMYVYQFFEIAGVSAVGTVTATTGNSTSATHTAFSATPAADGLLSLVGSFRFGAVDFGTATGYNAVRYTNRTFTYSPSLQANLESSFKVGSATNATSTVSPSTNWAAAVVRLTARATNPGAPPSDGVRIFAKPAVVNNTSTPMPHVLTYSGMAICLGTPQFERLNLDQDFSITSIAAALQNVTMAGSAPWRITFDNAGVYEVTLHAHLNFVSGTAGQTEVGISLNTTDQPGYAVANHQAGRTTVSRSWWIYAPTAGDYVQVRARKASGSSTVDIKLTDSTLIVKQVW